MPNRRGLPLLWKILLPYFGLVTLVTAAGAFLATRQLVSQTQSVLAQNLDRRYLEVTALLHDRELYLLESSNYAGSLGGIEGAVAEQNAAATNDLLRSVPALKRDLNVVVVVDDRGRTLAAFARQKADGPITRAAAYSWGAAPIVKQALHSDEGAEVTGFVRWSGGMLLATAAPICSGSVACQPVGVAISGITAPELMREIGGGSSTAAAAGSIGLYSQDGSLLASEAGLPPQLAPEHAGVDTATVALPSAFGSDQLGRIYGPFNLGGQRAGTLEIDAASAPLLPPVRDSTMRLLAILLVAIAGVAAIGWLLARYVLGQLAPLMATSRALGGGELSARAPVMSADELGELARGVNLMADQLQASYANLESRVEQRTAEIARLMRDRNDLFTGVTHDFRTPLAVIIAQSELLLDPTYQTDPAVANLGRTVKAAASQLLLLVNRVLDLAQSEAGRLVVNLEALDLAELLDEIGPTLEGLAHGSALDLRYELEPVPVVLADAFRTREVIFNLVDNAAKYSEPGGTITIRTHARAGWVELAVEDTGIGIPPGVGDRIFEPFYRVKTSRDETERPSSGLGLALTKKLVEAMNGEIAFENRKKGTRFTVSLPVAAVARATFLRVVG